VIVPISLVEYDTVTPSSMEVKRMAKTLEQQGQIEPLQVRIECAHYVVFHQDVWAPAIVEAAKKLGWPTLLIAVMERYEQ
jgi:hypothetical protein